MLAEFLMVAFLLAVGLLGLAALQTASVRAGGGAAARATALALAEGALEAALAQARTRDAAEAAPEEFGPDGLAVGSRPALFTLRVVRREAAPGVWEVQATVAWTEGAAPARRSLSLSRLVAR